MRLRLLCSAVFSMKKVFCLGEKQGMIVKNDCRLWYNRIGFLMSVWERRKKILDGEAREGCFQSESLLNTKQLIWQLCVNDVIVRHYFNGQLQDGNKRHSTHATWRILVGLPTSWNGRDGIIH